MQAHTHQPQIKDLKHGIIFYSHPFTCYVCFQAIKLHYIAQCFPVMEVMIQPYREESFHSGTGVYSDP